MSKKLKQVKRILKSSEIRDINSCIDSCDCDCHLEPYIMHCFPCCEFVYWSKIEIGEETYLDEKEIADILDRQIKKNNERSIELEKIKIVEERKNAWREAIVGTPLSKSGLNPSNDVVMIYGKYIKCEIELDECIETILKIMSDN